MRQKKMEREGSWSKSPGPAKEGGRGGAVDKEKEKMKKSSLVAMKEAVRNGDMFTEGDMFGEKYWVRENGYMYMYMYIRVYVCMCICIVLPWCIR